jgi:hypothetical protein
LIYPDGFNLFADDFNLFVQMIGIFIGGCMFYEFHGTDADFLCWGHLALFFLLNIFIGSWFGFIFFNIYIVEGGGTRNIWARFDILLRVRALGICIWRFLFAHVLLHEFLSGTF